MKNNKGFTVLELLIVIFIIGLIPLIFVNSFGKTRVNVDTEKDQIGKSLLDDAIEIFYYLGMKEGTLEYYLEDETIISCISLQTLISNGYLMEEQFDSSKHALLKVENGNVSYELITDTSVCNYEKVSISGIYVGETSSSGENDNDIDSYTFKQNVTTINVNTFNVDIEFTFQALIDYYAEDYKETYVMMVLDKSGSMSSMMSSANSAVTQLANLLAKNDSNNYKFCTGLISFDSSASLVKKFTNKPFISSLAYGGGTSFSAALSRAYSVIYETPNNYDDIECSNSASPDSHVIVILLSDGYGGSASTANLIEKNAQILTIGYGGDADVTTLKNLSTKSCGEEKNEACYFDSNPATISTQLQDFALTVISEAKESKYKKGIVELTLNDEYFRYDSADSSGVKNTEGIVSIAVDLEKYDEDGNILGDYAFNIKYNGKAFGEGINSIEIDVFKEVYITFYDSEGIPSEKIKVTDLPKITLNKFNASATN